MNSRAETVNGRELCCCCRLAEMSSRASLADYRSYFNRIRICHGIITMFNRVECCRGLILPHVCTRNTIKSLFKLQKVDLQRHQTPRGRDGERPDSFTSWKGRPMQAWKTFRLLLDFCKSITLASLADLLRASECFMPSPQIVFHCFNFYANRLPQMSLGGTCSYFVVFFFFAPCSISSRHPTTAQRAHLQSHLRVRISQEQINLSINLVVSCFSSAPAPFRSGNYQREIVNYVIGVVAIAWNVSKWINSELMIQKFSQKKKLKSAFATSV